MKNTTIKYNSLNKNNNISVLPDELNSILIGTLLSDGGLYRSSPTAIKTRLNIYTGVLHDRKDQWILTIGANNLELLRKTVRPHFHSSMLYRLGLGL